MSAVLAVDVGGTHIKWAEVAGGRITRRGRLDTPHAGARPLLERLVDLHDGAVAERLGLAVAGWVDPASGVVRHMTALGIEDWDVAAALQAARPALAARPVVVNDVVAACAAEAPGEPSLAVLAFGTGVSAKLARDGRPVAGAHGLAGELGHQTYRRGGRRCGCGRRGCVEAYAGWGGVKRAMRRRGLPGGPADLAERAAGDSAARRLLDEALDAAGFAAATLVAAQDPGVVRVGGGLAAAWGDRLLAAVRDGAAERAWNGARTRVEPARFGPDAPLIGVAQLAARAGGR